MRLPAAMRSKVLLPTPLAPSSKHRVPAAMDSDRPLKTAG